MWREVDGDREDIFEKQEGRSGPYKRQEDFMQDICSVRKTENNRINWPDVSGQEIVWDLKETSREHSLPGGNVGPGRQILGIKVMEDTSEKNESPGQDSGGLRKSNFTGASRENQTP